MQNQDPQWTEPPADAQQPAVPAPQRLSVGPPPVGQPPVGPPPVEQPDWAAAQGFAAPASVRTNGFAIASLVLGSLGGVLLSVIFGLIALRQIDQRDEKGRGLAIAGLALSGFWVLVVVAVFVFVPSGFEPEQDPHVDRAHSKVLAPGDCLDADLDEVLPCTEPHAGEVYTVFTLPDGPYPGDAEVEAEVEKRCVRSFEPYVEAASEDMELRYLGPSRLSWPLSRTVTCIAADPAGTLTGSLVKKPVTGR
ncbi:DUF4190 domain-containing protein [Actinoplanes sp. NPDC049668]|uniref:DUF4190 domain-containing protein n=1 Tax=unclassified Actinoplanes TaxID=2626549 RepID=UPI0033B096F3